MDTYDAEFSWPHTEPKQVILTGTFDQWSSSIHLAKTATGFTGTVKIPWGERVRYKFIVDGRWVIHDDQETERDPAGNVNNVYTAPPRPTPPTLKAPPATLAPEVVAPTPKDTNIPSAATNGSIFANIPSAATMLGSIKAAIPSMPNGKTDYSLPAGQDVQKAASKATETASATAAPVIDAASATASNIANTASANGSAAIKTASVQASETAKAAAGQAVDSVKTAIGPENTAKVTDTTSAAVSQVNSAAAQVASTAQVATAKAVEAAKSAAGPELTAKATDATNSAKDLAQSIGGTVAATDGTTSAFSYVASGLGVAIQSVVGVDPINGQQVALKTPIAEKGDTIISPLSPVPKPESPVMAPKIPIGIVPVNNASNNHAATSPSDTTTEISTHAPLKNQSLDAGVAQTRPLDKVYTPDTTAVAASDAKGGIGGNADVPALASPPTTATPAELPPVQASPPTTPTKKNTFPKPSSPSSQLSRSSSAKFDTASSGKKKKRVSSIFGKVKGIFGKDKDKEKETN